MAVRIILDAAIPPRRLLPSNVRANLEPRTIFFPPGVLSRIDTRPGQLVEVLTLALSAYLADGKGAGQ